MWEQLFGLLDKRNKEFLENIFTELHLDQVEEYWEEISDDGRDVLLNYYVEIIEGLNEIYDISHREMQEGDSELKQSFMDGCGLVLVNRNLLIDMFVLNIKRWVKRKAKKVKKAIFKSSTAVVSFIRGLIFKLAKWLKLQSWSINITGGVTLGLAPTTSYSAGLTFTFGP